MPYRTPNQSIQQQLKQNPKSRRVSLYKAKKSSFINPCERSVAKKANILNQLAPTAAESASPRSYSEQSSPQVSAPPSPRPQQTQQQRRPVIDDDMGIVPMNQARPPSSHQHYQERQSPDRDRPNQMTPKQQNSGKVKVNLRSRADRDDGGSLTAGQRRAAAELERIKRDQ
ncbi:hypothetical protein ANCDUO_27555, partial [Ancylostoma duodenale]